MWLAIAILLGVIWLAIDFSEKHEAKKRYEYDYERGIYDKEDEVKHRMLRQDFLEDFKGERKAFPAEYIPYFEQNHLALECYVTHLAWREEMKMGLKPSMTGYMFYDKRTFDPMKEFEKTKYARFIKEYNENGKLYYY